MREPDPAIAATCPMRGSDDRRTAVISGLGAGPEITRDAQGAWIIRSLSLARQVLKSTATRQAGFAAESMDPLPASIKRPVIFLEGHVHNEMRRGTARYFTPRAVAENYHLPMSALADRLVAELIARGSANMDDLGLELAMTMTAQIVGLTETGITGMAKILDRMVQPIRMQPRHPLYPLVQMIHGRVTFLRFYVAHVRPSIRARRKQPRDDVISHLISIGYDNPSIAIETATYAPAGMSTTREFMSLTVWHFLDRPALKARFLASTDEEKRSILEEILRLEPVVSQLMRRTLEDIELQAEAETVTVPKGALIRIDTRAANHDPAVTECPFALNPDRTLDTNMTRAVLTFGDGIHRCPGIYVALQESAIFLSKLLAVPNLRAAAAPQLRHNPQVGYELRNFTLITRPA